MKLNLSKLLFLMTFTLGIMMSTSSNNWILIWCGLEISMISFIPLMVTEKIISAESTIKYFIVQSVSSSLLMLGMLIMIMKGEYNYDYMVTSSLLIKMGVAPFHNWILTVNEGLTHSTMFLMLTINKLAPLTLLSYQTSMLMMLILVNATMASMMSVNQNSIKKIITYSSIFNMAFILATIKLNLMWSVYMLVYSMLLLMMIWIMEKFKLMFINQIIILENKMMNKTTLWVIMLSMGGMPPLMGFSIKYMVIQLMINKSMYMILLVLILTSLIMMMIYLRMTFIATMNLSMTMKCIKYNTVMMTNMVIMINMMWIPMVMSMKLFY